VLHASPRIDAQWDELRVILDSVPAFIWYKDADNRIVRANRRAAESMGLSVAAIEGRSTYELYPEDAAKYHHDDSRSFTRATPSSASSSRS